MSAHTEDLFNLLESLSHKWKSTQDDLPLTGQEGLDANSVATLTDMADRLQNNYPYASPLYAGQMLKPPHAIARAAYAFAQQINPNNHALDGGKESSAMEIEAVEEIARMFGWNGSLGHLTGGGTMANLEALWIGSQLHPGKKVAASKAAHYTHERITAVLQIPFESVPCQQGKPVMDLNALEDVLKKGDIGTVVVTAGTTGTGHVEPISDIIGLATKYKARVHVDAAYGGYFRLIDFTDPDLQRHFDAISEADSIVIDPHKHGLQPYGCGCVLFKDPSVGRFYKHDSPYTYFTSDRLHLGEITLECSRPGAAAVALLATQKRFPLIKKGEMSQGLSNCLSAANELYKRLSSSDEWLLPFKPDLDIIIFAPQAHSISEISRKSQALFNHAEKAGLYLALYKMSSNYIQNEYIHKDASEVTLLRSTLMKWNHIDHIDDIFNILTSSVHN